MALARTRATAVWFVLVAATILSWWLGHGGNGGHELIGAVILLVAFIKVRLIGSYFMELREAPVPLRALFDGYCLVVCSVVLGMFLWA
jgi:heme/copper-type cytochrome/quinol oxidase subunit 4